jgi:hypothetical protein
MASVFAVADKVFVAGSVASMKLAAVKYAGEEWGNTGLYATVSELEPTASRN